MRILCEPLIVASYIPARLAATSTTATTLHTTLPVHRQRCGVRPNLSSQQPAKVAGVIA